MNKISIIGLVGESVFMTVERFHNEGETIHADNFFTELGGKGFNQAIAAKRSGAEVSFLCASGSDEYYKKIKVLCKKEGIDATVIKKNGRTAYGVIERDKNGSNRVLVYKGAVLKRDDVKCFEKKIKNSDILLLTNEIPQEVNLYAVRIAKKYGVKIVFNPAPIREIEDEILNSVYLFTPNEHEKDYIKDRDNAVITQGSKGVLIKSMNLTVKAPKVVAVDTTGAGDIFNGSMCAMLSRGKSLEDAVSYATKCASMSVTKSGVINSIPFLEQVKE